MTVGWLRDCESGLRIVSQPAARLTAGLRHILNPRCNVLLWLKADISSRCITRGERFKWRGCWSDLLMIPPSPLLQICAIVGGTFTVAGIIDSCIFTASEAWKKIQIGKMSWGLPPPPLILFISAMLLACLLNPIPTPIGFLFGDYITRTKEAALALDPTIRLQRLQLSYFRSSRAPSAPGTPGRWLSHVHFLCFQRQQGEMCQTSTPLGVGKLFLVLIFLAWSLCPFLKLALEPYSRVFPDQPEHENRPSGVSPLSWWTASTSHSHLCAHYPLLTLMNRLYLVCTCRPPERWRHRG